MGHQLPSSAELVDRTVKVDNAFAEFGKPLLKDFIFRPGFRNLNHGSFGTMPRAIMDKQQEYYRRANETPDPFIRYEYPKLLIESRAALAKLLNAPLDTVTLVPNATNGVNVILRNLVWKDDGKDEIISFSTIYGSCGKTIQYLVETSRGLLSSRVIDLVYPLEDDEIVDKFVAAVEASRAEGKRPRAAVFDVVTSQPGVRFPFEKVTAQCRELGVLSVVDGAQGIGMLPLDLTALDPDFFVSNNHKWLHVPRPSAVLYVPSRNQPIMASTLPTSRGYAGFPAPAPSPDVPALADFPPNANPEQPPFIRNFSYIGTLDDSPHLCVKDAVEWREKVLGGEDRIIKYLWWLAREGGKTTASQLGTSILENESNTLTNQAMVNVFLPIGTKSGIDNNTPSEGGDGFVFVPEQHAQAARDWITQTLISEYDTFIPLGVLPGGKWYVRLSAQVYLDMEDFEWAGKTLKELCERAGRFEYKELVKTDGFVR